MTTPGGDAVLRVRGVTKSFGGAAALKGVDLDLHPGEVHALMGMNGAGKSTLVQVLSGIHQPDGGTVEVNGQAQHGLTVRKARRLGIASVPQRRELAMGLTVAEQAMVEVAREVRRGLRPDGGRLHEGAAGTAKVVANQPGTFNPVKAQDVAENMIQAHPALQYAFVASEDMALAARKAFDAVGKEDVKIVTANGTDEGLAAVAVGLLAKKKVDKIANIPLLLVTKDNLNKAPQYCPK
ncbi:ATP-binding cassette domain-containing protein [Streptomyces sp. NBC_01622]|uniref:ATP-binding cassette domain-containing protein n=1 Tax=Streptomyces sp. NBC_01622 TaxID=2975903 RepID=UPI00386A1CEC